MTPEEVATAIAVLQSEDERQNKRLSELEEIYKPINKLNTTVALLSNSVENMAKMQQEQNKRLSDLEGGPGRKWKRLVQQLISTLVPLAVNGTLFYLVYQALQSLK